MGGPRKATAPEVTTTPAPETAVVPDPDATGEIPAAPVIDGDAQTPDPAGADTPAVPDPDTADSTPPVDPDSDTSEAAADVADMVVVMNIAITGTVDGEPWPAPGGEISLPTAEAERYVRLGYARFPEK